MNDKQRRASRALGAAACLAACLAFAGCAQAPKSLYGWGGYQGQVYAYFKGADNGPQAQAAALEADLQKISAAGAVPAPGLHAHLGLLYSSLGQDDLAVQHLQAEKALFPESTQYIDFLLAQARSKK